MSHNNVTDRAPRKELLGFNLDTAIPLPERRVSELPEMLEAWPEKRNKATVREVLGLAGKLHHVSYVIR